MRCVAWVLIAAAAATGCGDDSAPRAAGKDAPLPSTRLDPGPTPVRNPLNLYDIGIPGAREAETAGTVDGIPVTMRDLEAQSVGAFGRIGARLYEARDRGYRWLLQRTALRRRAELAGVDLDAFLAAEFAALPAPPAAELQPLEAELTHLPPAEATRAARSLWRWKTWVDRRDLLIAEGAVGLVHERYRRRISTPDYAEPGTIVARVDGREVARAEMEALAGVVAEEARREYFALVRMHFDDYVNRLLVEREARHLGVDAATLERRAAAALGPIREAEVRAYVAEFPEYARDPRGRERARDQVRRLREAGALDQMRKRLRASADIEFDLREPEPVLHLAEPPAPRGDGPAGPPTLAVYHALGCDVCVLGARVVLTLIDQMGGRVRVLTGESFAPGRLASYRAALAVRCADDQGGGWRLAAELAREPGNGQIGDLVGRSAAAGVDAATLEACLEADRHLPAIAENLEFAARLGVEPNRPAVFVDGLAIPVTRDVGQLVQQVVQALN